MGHGTDADTIVIGLCCNATLLRCHPISIYIMIIQVMENRVMHTNYKRLHKVDPKDGITLLKNSDLHKVVCDDRHQSGDPITNRN